MYRIKKPSTNYENIPVSTMEGPSSPTSITFWKKDATFPSDSKDTVSKYKSNYEKLGSSFKHMLPRVKHVTTKSIQECGTVYNSQTLIGRSRSSSPPLIRYEGGKASERPTTELRKPTVEYRKPSGNGSPIRDNEHQNQLAISLSSTGTNHMCLTSNCHNAKNDASDISRDVSTINTFTDLPPDVCWANSYSKPLVSTKDCTVQTSNCFIKNPSPILDENSIKAFFNRKSYRSGSAKGLGSSMKQKSKGQQSLQSSRNRSQISSQPTAKRKIKIPDHKIIYMDKLDPIGSQFWDQITSEMDKKQTTHQGRSKRGHL